MVANGLGEPGCIKTGPHPFWGSLIWGPTIEGPQIVPIELMLLMSPSCFPVNWERRPGFENLKSCGSADTHSDQSWENRPLHCANRGQDRCLRIPQRPKAARTSLVPEPLEVAPSFGGGDIWHLTKPPRMFLLGRIMITGIRKYQAPARLPVHCSSIRLPVQSGEPGGRGRDSCPLILD